MWPLGLSLHNSAQSWLVSQLLELKTISTVWCCYWKASRSGRWWPGGDLQTWSEDDNLCLFRPEDVLRDGLRVLQMPPSPLTGLHLATILVWLVVCFNDDPSEVLRPLLLLPASTTTVKLLILKHICMVPDLNSGMWIWSQVTQKTRPIIDSTVARFQDSFFAKEKQ